MIVMKFGGSSVESASAIRRVAAIVRESKDQQRIVVVSAMGKTTDRLLAIARMTAAGNIQDANRETTNLLRFHLAEASQLARGAAASDLENALRGVFEELAGSLREIEQARLITPQCSDAVASVGERLSSLIVTAGFQQAGLNAVHLDSRTAIVTDRNHTQAAPLFPETNALLRRRIFRDRVTVMGGFIGATEDGVTTTLGRGGSDYSAAIVGAALSVDEIQIWTDVDGMLTCDPRVVSGAHCVKALSFSEAEQMAKAGAKVLHPATVAPAVKRRIPIAIRNSRNAAAPGTRIVTESPCDGSVMSIACRTGVTLLHLNPRNTPVTPDFGREIWDVFEAAGVQLEPIALSRKTISVAADAAALTPELRTRLTEIADLNCEDDRAIVTLIGHNASRNSSNLARASRQLCALPGGAIMTVSSDSRFAFVTSGESLQPACAALHDEFFGQPNPEYFVVNRMAVSSKATALGRDSRSIPDRKVASLTV
jgi:aspartate kinase